MNHPRVYAVAAFVGALGTGGCSSGPGSGGADRSISHGELANPWRYLTVSGAP
jgi:hypothetical protein